jgi:hypothetical protein
VPVTLRRAERLAVGHRHACVIRPSNFIECWGTAEAIEDVPGDGDWDAIWADEGSTCALTTTGLLQCWGDFGRLADVGVRYTEADLGDGGFLSAVRESDGGIDRWNGDAVNPEAIPGVYSGLACGSDHCCGLRASDQQIICWGDLSDEVPAPASPTGAVLESGGSTVCTLSEVGLVTCWGQRDCVDGAPAGQATDLSVGPGCSSCAVLLDGELHCWGSGGIGQLDEPAGPFVEVDNSADYACGIRPTGDVDCWGGD